MNGPRYFRCLSIAILTATASMSLGQTLFINEFHYDNTGTDSDEGVEIAGPAGTNLTGFSVLLYNGNGGTVSNTLALGGTIPNEGGKGFGAVWFPVSGMQNDTEGVALVQNSGSVVLQRFAYEGVMTGVGGAANGLVFNNIGVSEAAATPPGQSLQLTGSGTAGSDFTWSGPVAHSRGFLNAGQRFGAAGVASVFSLNPAMIKEGAMAMGTLSLSPAPLGPVVCRLKSVPEGRVGLPESVVVPVSGTMTFSVTALADGRATGFQEVTLVATPEGLFNTAEVVLQVVDADRPARSGPGVLRLMSLNVRLGVGASGTAEFVAVREVIERISPDVLLLQEVSDAGDFADVRVLLEQVGFPVGAGFLATRGDAFAGVVYSSGDFGTGECVITASRFPIVSTIQIGRGVAGRKELTRFPLYSRIDLPGPDLHVVNVHLKAGTLDTDRFRKAVEAYRIKGFLSQQSLTAALDNIVVGGDFNAIDSIFLPALSYQTSSYTPPAGTSLPAGFQLGTDLAVSPGVVLPYSVPPYNAASSVYPHIGFNPVGLFAAPLRQADGASAGTFNLFDVRFDYFMLPQRLQSPGHSRGEVYNSRLEAQADGLPKRLTLPAAELSETASDHYALFLDLNLTPQPVLGLTVSPDNLDEASAGPPPVATVSLAQAPSAPVVVKLGLWRDERVRFSTDTVLLTPSQPSQQVPMIVPYLPLVEPSRAITLTAVADGYASAYASLTVRSAEAAGLLVFSQYVEPSPAGAPPDQNPSRALEFYNASGETLDLARLKWIIRRYTNGSRAAVILGSVSDVFPEESVALLPAGQVIVVGEAAVGDAMVAAGLLPAPALSIASAAAGTLFCNPAGQAVFLKGSSMDYNGDDALEIVADGVRCDVFGQIGQDPGNAWTGGPGNPSTADQNLSLRPEIFTGSTGFTLPGTRFLTTAAGNSLAGIGIPPVPADRYLTWTAGQGMKGIPRAPNSDPDGDGRLNLIEFLEETNPVKGDSAAGFRSTGSGGSIQGFFLTLAPDPWLGVGWESSGSLSSPWVPATEVTGSMENSRTRWQWNVNPAGSQRRFWRMRAGRP